MQGRQMSSGSGPVTSDPPESNSAEMPKPPSSPRGARQAMQASKRPSNSRASMNSLTRSSQSISRARKSRTAAFESSESRPVTLSRQGWQIAYSSTHSPSTISLFTSHGASISTSGSLHPMQCENASPSSSEASHSSIVRMANPSRGGGA